jgi:hypothetical protein
MKGAIQLSTVLDNSMTTQSFQNLIHFIRTCGGKKLVQLCHRPKTVTQT